jgi:mono/diheme cytochrome c family protein
MRIALVLLALAALGACTGESTPNARLRARGEYLVTSVGGCNDCHTVMTLRGPDFARSLQGADLVFGPLIDMPWAPHAPNLAGGPANFTDEQFETFLQTGVRPDGSRPLPPMPPFRFNEADARAIVAYIRTLPAAEPGPDASAISASAE